MMIRNVDPASFVCQPCCCISISIAIGASTGLTLAKHDIRSHFDDVAFTEEASLVTIFTAFGWIDAAIAAKNHESPGLLQTPLLVAAALHFSLSTLYPALRKMAARIAGRYICMPANSIVRRRTN